MGYRDEVFGLIKRHGIFAALGEFQVEVGTVEGAARATGFSPSQIVKALIVRVDDGYAAVVLPGDKKVALSKVAKVLRSRNIRLANAEEVAVVTEFEVGVASPLSDRVRSLRVIFDSSVIEKDWVWCGGGSLDSSAYVLVWDFVRVFTTSSSRCLKGVGGFNA